MTEMTSLPVAVIGAGPVGLAAAAHLLARGIPVKVYEAGETVAANVRDWGHVRLFSPWGFNLDEAARTILKRHGWQDPPRDAYPTGEDLYEAYLRPLAETPDMRAVVETGARIRAISRQGLDKVGSKGRETHPFVLSVVNGAARRDFARAVIDASGTWTSPNPVGAGGVPADGWRRPFGRQRAHRACRPRRSRSANTNCVGRARLQSHPSLRRRQSRPTARAR
jgi:cation diffusion facilitator CzcD-associated flavoprotein CzcO